MALTALVASFATAVAAARPAAFVQGQAPRVLTSGPGDARAPAWSPDGTRLAYEQRVGDQWDLFVVDVRSSQVTRLTEHAADDRYPAWSPDGKEVAFQSQRDRQADLYVMRLADRRVRRLTTSATSETFPHWSRDGARIAFTAPDIEGTLNIFSVDVDDGSVRQLTAEGTRAVWPRWSADGRRLAYFSRRDTSGAADDIYVLDPATGTSARVTTSAGHDFCPTWSPDGERLAVVSIPPVGPRSIRVVTLGGLPLAELAVGEDGATEPDWAPSGRQIAYTARRDGVFRVVVAEIPPAR